MSLPGLWKRVPGMLLDATGPLSIRWADLPWLVPWLWRFLAAGNTVEKVQATSRSLAALVLDAAGRHAGLAARAGIADLIRETDLLYVFPDRIAFERDSLAWRLRRENGVLWSELTSEDLTRREPDLSQRYSFAACVEGAAYCLDPGAYVSGLVHSALAKGAKLLSTRARSFVIQQNRLTGVVTDQGTISCDHAVVCAGIASPALAKQVGDYTPLASERGYHVALPGIFGGPRSPVMPSDGKMANTVTNAGLRAAGQVEQARVTTPPDWRRAEILHRHLVSTYPGLEPLDSTARISRWMGHRPSTPDSLPVIAAAPTCNGVILAYGHGHSGLCAGPKTAQLVLDIVAGREAAIPLHPYRPNRF